MDLARRGKRSQLLNEIRGHVDRGSYFIVPHALCRQEERHVTDPELTWVLRKGRREVDKDRFDPAYDAWNYSIRGRTVDGRDLRVIVSFDDDVLIIVTVIELSK